MTDSTANDSPRWEQIIFAPQPPDQVWRAIFETLRGLALASTAPQFLNKATIVPDRLLAEAAWSLWSAFPQAAPSVIDELKQFWTVASASGTAVLVLDALSLRELRHLVSNAQERGIVPTRVEVRAAQVPTETDRFAQALGLFGRSKLENNQAPATFLFAGTDTCTDVFCRSFEDCVASVPASPRLFFWQTWPDDLIHHHENDATGHNLVAKQASVQLASDGFWKLVNRMRQGRRLVITSDHGYAVSQLFSSPVQDEETVKRLRQTFHAGRCVKESPTTQWPSCHLPPLAARHDGWLVVMGQRKWTVQGGFPHLCHGGLTLLEAAVPYVELPPM